MFAAAFDKSTSKVKVILVLASKAQRNTAEHIKNMMIAEPELSMGGRKRVSI